MAALTSAAEEDATKNERTHTSGVSCNEGDFKQEQKRRARCTHISGHQVNGASDYERSWRTEKSDASPIRKVRAICELAAEQTKGFPAHSSGISGSERNSRGCC